MLGVSGLGLLSGSVFVIGIVSSVTFCSKEVLFRDKAVPQACRNSGSIQAKSGLFREKTLFGMPFRHRKRMR